MGMSAAIGKPARQVAVEAGWLRPKAPYRPDRRIEVEIDLATGTTRVPGSATSPAALTAGMPEGTLAARRGGVLDGVEWQERRLGAVRPGAASQALDRVHFGDAGAPRIRGTTRYSEIDRVSAIGSARWRNRLTIGVQPTAKAVVGDAALSGRSTTLV
jgi:hypothetical protein